VLTDPRGTYTGEVVCGASEAMVLKYQMCEV
jgi:hypothetical protein